MNPLYYKKKNLLKSLLNLTISAALKLHYNPDLIQNKLIKLSFFFEIEFKIN